MQLGQTQTMVWGSEKERWDATLFVVGTEKVSGPFIMMNSIDIWTKMRIIPSFSLLLSPKSYQSQGGIPNFHLDSVRSIIDRL